ncbi:hypothetical protein [Kushneria indalinina]|uniref:hypothetical protein n=1 Tax=Kushneria indalinina TaxID=184067 RepID=UPI001475385A|nr:hypothetical protein [Kushneria indalinina]
MNVLNAVDAALKPVMTCLSRFSEGAAISGQKHSPVLQGVYYKRRALGLQSA